MQRVKRRLSSLGSWKGSIFQSFEKKRSSASAVLITGSPGEVEIRVAVWLCMIRCRLPNLQSKLFESISCYKFKRKDSPIDMVMRTWMVGTLYECSAIHIADPCDEKALPVLHSMIELMIQESCEINDYRVFFLFVMNRLNVYVEHLVCGIIPTHGVGLNWN